MTQPKILALDIETKPITAYVWRTFKENIGLEQIIEDGGIICVGAKWVGSKEDIFVSEWEHGKETMLQTIHELLCEADAVITYNGDSFDLKKLNGEFLLAGMKPPPPPTSIDCIKTVRKLGYTSNRLAYIGPLMKVGAKVKHEGFGLWRGVMDGDPRAQGRMKKYCIQDVKLLVQLYRRILPFIRNHPHLGTIKADRCGACGSKSVHKRGFRRTKSFIIQRLQCNSCGSWSDGTRKKV